MGERFNWREEDGRMAEEEALEKLGLQKAYLARLAAEECKDEWIHYLHSLTIEEEQAALDGFQWYIQHYLDDLDIDVGWHKVIEEDT